MVMFIHIMKDIMRNNKYLKCLKFGVLRVEGFDYLELITLGTQGTPNFRHSKL